jgi:hypothetical protein
MAAPSGQGQLQLKPSARKHFQQEVVVPGATPAFHGDTSFARMLFEQRERESIQPGVILTQPRFPDP